MRGQILFVCLRQRVLLQPVESRECWVREAERIPVSYLFLLVTYLPKSVQTRWSHRYDSIAWIPAVESINKGISKVFSSGFKSVVLKSMGILLLICSLVTSVLSYPGNFFLCSHIYERTSYGIMFNGNITWN